MCTTYFMHSTDYINKYLELPYNQNLFKYIYEIVENLAKLSV